MVPCGGRGRWLLRVVVVADPCVDLSPDPVVGTVLFVAVFSTVIADGPHVSLGSPCYVDAAIYFVLLCGLLYWWKRSEGTLDIHSITSSRRERFY